MQGYVQHFVARTSLAIQPVQIIMFQWLWYPTKVLSLCTGQNLFTLETKTLRFTMIPSLRPKSEEHFFRSYSISEKSVR